MTKSTKHETCLFLSYHIYFENSFLNIGFNLVFVICFRCLTADCFEFLFMNRLFSNGVLFEGCCQVKLEWVVEAYVESWVCNGRTFLWDDSHRLKVLRGRGTADLVVIVLARNDDGLKFFLLCTFLGLLWSFVSATIFLILSEILLRLFNLFTSTFSFHKSLLVFSSLMYSSLNTFGTDPFLTLPWQYL